MINCSTGCPTLPLWRHGPVACLGGGNGAGFGWDDMTTYKLGFEWQTDENNTWRFGYSYGEQPIRTADVLFNILAPGVMEQHLTVGWTAQRDGGNVMDLLVHVRARERCHGPSLFDPHLQQ